MPSFDKIDWSKVTLPKDVKRENVKRDYENAIEDLKLLSKEFDRYFAGKKMRQARVQMMTDNIFRAVNDNVTFRANGMLDVERLLQFIANDDRPLFADVCKFTYQFYADKPMNGWRLSQFKGLLTYFLCRAGF